MTIKMQRVAALLAAIDRCEAGDPNFNLWTLCKEITGMASGGDLYSKVSNMRSGRVKSVSDETIGKLSDKYPKIGTFFETELLNIAANKQSVYLDPRFSFVENKIKENDAAIDGLLSRLQNKVLTLEEGYLIVNEHLNRLERRILTLENRPPP